jgi:hypothetical protein
MRKRIMLSGLLFGAAVCGALVAFGQESPEQGRVIVQTRPIGPGGQGNAFFWRTDGEGGQKHNAELSAKISEELQDYTAAKDDGGREKAKKQLQNALGELFDLRQKEREEEIKQIEERVAHLRDTLKKRDSMRQDLIDHHLTTLIQDAEGLGWGSDGPGAGINYAPLSGPQGYGLIRGRAGAYTAPSIPAGAGQALPELRAR